MESVLRRLLRDADMRLDVSPSHPAAQDLLASRKFHAILLDCDDLHAAEEFLKRLRQHPVNGRAIVFAILSGSAKGGAAFRMGAHFVLDKPISTERGARTLRAAGSLIRARAEATA
ncbi:MAG TPA: hypothetical protein VNK82_13920 [Terriglobales bacterium]|nr:hypothetical protein [Terriglobales bacterium]